MTTFQKMNKTEKDLFSAICECLDCEPAIVHDPDDQMPWSVWFCDDILGVGDTQSEALVDALNECRLWESRRKMCEK